MWQPWRWASASNTQAVENARAASVACSRRLVEHAEVEDFLSALAATPEPVRSGPVTAQHPA